MADLTEWQGITANLVAGRHEAIQNPLRAAAAAARYARSGDCISCIEARQSRTKNQHAKQHLAHGYSPTSLPKLYPFLISARPTMLVSSRACLRIAAERLALFRLYDLSRVLPLPNLQIVPVWPIIAKEAARFALRTMRRAGGSGDAGPSHGPSKWASLAGKKKVTVALIDVQLQPKSASFA
ncbi:uncharacterized protein MEPE_04825 [Melanopsichium pennsylvanicum]|uniref:Uncharacterized protein n=1 Tax=Melanopsichium pennsylvanicum TaxID=63383 RepID=A0AAJ5C6Q8_9BASI|nr:uncharacterized protein MEPE_04825 [Melanopsichium pennsylvanicum]